MLNEFEIINRFFKRAPSNATTVLGSGDDAAIVAVPPNEQLVVSTDTMVAGVHFSLETPAHAIGHKSLAVSISDMVAMGAVPIGATIALTIPEINEQWLASYAAGLFDLAERYQVDLVGGDLTRGHLSITSTVFGLVPKGTALLRSGAKVGDLIYVSGYIGNAGLALKLLGESEVVPETILQALHYPAPRTQLAVAIRHIATAAIDITDGLAQDLSHILHASGVGARVYAEMLPISLELQKALFEKDAWRLALTAGDDYELCFTVPERAKEELNLIAKHLNQPVYCIGNIVEPRGLEVIDANNEIWDIGRGGYKHFE